MFPSANCSRLFNSNNPSTPIYPLLTNKSVDNTIEHICHNILTITQLFTNSMEKTSKTLSTGIRRQSFHFQLFHLQAVQRSGNGIYAYSNPTSSVVIMNKSGSSFVLLASLQLRYRRYMEDTFTCCTSAGKPQNFLSCMKGRHPNIKLIAQIQEPQSLTFLILQCHY